MRLLGRLSVRMLPRSFLPLILSLALASTGLAKVIGTNPPSLPLTAERIASLPTDQQAPWKAYLERSIAQMKADQAALLAEVKAAGLTEILSPSHGHGGGLPRNEKPKWYGQPEALRIADIVVSFQTPGGGWSKNLSMTDHARRPGEHFAADNSNKIVSSADNDAPPASGWSYVSTFDNNATITQIRFLAKVVSALGESKAEKYKAACLRGVEFALAAQYPNGGWPQVWPLQGGYHDAITLNDSAMTNIIELLQDVGSGEEGFSFVSKELRARARASEAKALACIAACQIRVDGQRTVWCQQHDMLTLQPASARNYEMPSQCTSESAALLQFIMRLKNPTPELVEAVHAAVAWFGKVEIKDVSFRHDGNEGRHLVSSPGAEPLWARYYEIGTNRPIFGDRDKTIHDNFDEISKERRNGYSWFNDSGRRILEHYIKWSRVHPRS